MINVMVKESVQRYALLRFGRLIMVNVNLFRQIYVRDVKAVLLSVRQGQ